MQPQHTLWSDVMPHFCEGFGTPAGAPEWVNVLTSSAMSIYGFLGVLAVLAPYIQPGDKRDHTEVIKSVSYGFHLSFAGLCVCGLNSTIYHASLFRGWAGMDVGGMIFTILPFLFETLHIVLVISKKMDFIIKVVVMIIASELGILTICLGSLEVEGHTQSSIAFGILMTIAYLLVLWLVIDGYTLRCGCKIDLDLKDESALRPESKKLYLRGLVVTSIALVAWLSTESVCLEPSISDSVKYGLRLFPAHGIWHIAISYGAYHITLATFLSLYKDFEIYEFDTKFPFVQFLFPFTTIRFDNSTMIDNSRSRTVSVIENSGHALIAVVKTLDNNLSQDNTLDASNNV